MLLMITGWTEAEDPDDCSFVVQCFGRDANGQTACIEIRDYEPYFYVKVPSTTSVPQLRSALKKSLYNRELRQESEALHETWKNRAIARIDLLDKQDFMAGWRNGARESFAKVSVRSAEAIKCIDRTIENRWGSSRDIVVAGRKLTKDCLYESNLPPLLRFFHDLQIEPAGYITVDESQMTMLPKKHSTTCDVHASVPWTAVKPAAPVNIARVVTCWDLEVYSKSGRFPQASEGDPIIQAGFVTRQRDGSLRKDILVLGTCDRWPEATDNVTIRCFENEAALLEGIQEIILELDPDTLVDYNGWGFDHPYLMERAQALGVELQLGRLKETTQLLETKTSLASGDYRLRYMDLAGRLSVDMNIVMRRDHKLSSYKLDDVSSHFMTGPLKHVKSDDRRVLFTSGQSVIKPGDSIRFVVHLDTNTALFEWRKFTVAEIRPDGIVLTEPLPADCPAKDVCWCLSKDDMSPSELFKCHRGTATDRGQIAKYCLMDCELTLQLFTQLNIHVNMTGMANACSVPMNFLLLRGQGIKTLSLVARECAKRDQVIRRLFVDQAAADSNEIGYEGAIVLEPDVGMYFEEPVPVGDFASLYPSSIISHNISHDTLVWVKTWSLSGELLSMSGDEAMDNLPGAVYETICYDNKQDDKVISRTECRYVQSETYTGTLPLIERMLLSQRRDVKKLLKTTTDAFQIDVLNGQQLAYKLVANSLYGQLGSKKGPVGLVHLAASITAVGRENIMKAKNYVESNYDAKVIYGDSVTGDTALVLRQAGKLLTRRIDEVVMQEEAWQSYHGDKDAVTLDGIEVWTEAGWTPVRRVIRHRCGKPIYRVFGMGFEVDVTEDHSLLDEHGNKLSPRDCKDQKLLTVKELPTPEAEDHFKSTTESVFSLGVFLARGIVKADGSIVLDLESIEDDRERGLILVNLGEPADAKQVVIRNRQRLRWLLRYCYNRHGEKIVPRVMLNCRDPLLLRAFLSGFEDSCPEELGKEGQTGIDLVKFNFGQRLESMPPYAHVFKHRKSYDDYVYDLETASHHFHVGPGRLVVHNTDSIFIKFTLPPGLNDLEKVAEAIRLGKHATKAISTNVVKAPHEIVYEKTFYPFILIKTKGYVGLKYEDDPTRCKKDSKGIALQRRDYADIVKDIYGGAINVLLYEKSVPKAQAFVVEQLSQLMRGRVPLSKLVITKSLKDNYAKPETIAQWCLAERMRARDPGSAPAPGDRIPYVFVKQAKKSKVSDSIEHADYVRAHPTQCTPDAVYYLEKQVKQPVEQLFALAVEHMSGFTRPKNYYERLRRNLAVMGKTPEQIAKEIEQDKKLELKRLLFETDTSVRRLDSFFAKKP